MKKFIIKNAMALVALAIAGTTLMSFGLEGRNIDSTKSQTALHWYEVNPATNQTMGTAAFNDTKENVIEEQACKDTPNQPICLFGSSDPSLPSGTNVGSPSPENRILQSAD